MYDEVSQRYRDSSHVDGEDGDGFRDKVKRNKRNDQFEGSVHKGSISRNPNFSGNEFLCFASFTLSFYQHTLAIVY